MNIYFKKIRTINPTQNLDSQLNIWIKDGLILHCSADEPTIDADTVIIEGKDLICSPGFFDMHVHFRDPGDEYKEDIQSGCNSAANGGFTGVCIMPNTKPVIDNTTVVEYIKSKSRNLLTDVHCSAAITQGRDGKSITPMLELVDAGVVMFTDDGSCVVNSETMRRAFCYTSNYDILISQHCEDHDLTEHFSANEGAMSARLGLKGYPSIAEEIIANRDILLSEYYHGRPYHLAHVSTKGTLRVVADAKKRGLPITCEVTPHHFTLTEGKLEFYDTNYKMNPPLRTQEDVDAIIEGLHDGTIDCIASDHAPHAFQEKDVEFEKAPNGIIGLETSIGLSINNLVHTNIITIHQLIEKMSINPRKILKLKEIKISIGEKANMTIFNPNDEWIVDKSLFKSKSTNTPFNGMKLKGKPCYTINNGYFHKCEL